MRNIIKMVMLPATLSLALAFTVKCGDAIDNETDPTLTESKGDGTGKCSPSVIPEVSKEKNEQDKCTGRCCSENGEEGWLKLNFNKQVQVDEVRSLSTCYCKTSYSADELFQLGSIAKKNVDPAAIRLPKEAPVPAGIFLIGQNEMCGTMSLNDSSWMILKGADIEHRCKPGFVCKINTAFLQNPNTGSSLTIGSCLPK